MKYSTRLSDAMHILAFITLQKDETLTSDRIAESLHTNPACVRLLMSKMRSCGIIASVKGHPRPSLTRDPAAITLFEVYRAVEGDKPLLHLDTHTNPACGVGVNIQLSLADCFARVQARAEEEMRSITLADVLEAYRRKIAALAAGAALREMSVL